jgi:hypothetical protein
MSGIGSIVLLILGLGPFYDKPIPRWIVLIVGLACFFFATAKVWTDEHRLRIQKEKELVESSVPGFKAEFRGPFIIFPTHGDKNTAMSMEVRITNMGAPSIADRFSTRLIFADGREVIGVEPVLPASNGNLSFERKTGQSALVYSMQEYLPRKATIQPIPRNGALSGFILSVFQGVSLDSIYDGKTKLVMICEDVHGKRAVAEHVFSTQQDNATVIDGSTLQMS